MLSDALDFLASKYGNVVLKDADGNPSVYIPFYKCLSSDLDASLPGHTHPAFVVGSTEYDRILIGKYMASPIGNGSNTLVSVPGKAPKVSQGADQFLSQMRAFKTGASGLTVADHGLILLTAKKNGWVPKGNNSWSVDYRDGTTFELAKSVSVGNKRVFRGWEYECLIAHTTDAEHLPSESPAYWKPTGRQLGGTPVASQFNADSRYQGYNTLTGSGPLSWCLGNDPGNLVDIQGNAAEQVYGYRLVDGEIQILPNNDAADPAADLSAASRLWKAIKPSLTDETYTLVDPGTNGTLHWNWLNGKVTLDTTSIVEDQYRNTAFTQLAVDSTHVPYIPSIVRELGLFPCSGDTVTQGQVYVNTSGERFPRRGGYCYSTSYAGLGCMYATGTRSSSHTYSGARGRFLEI